LSQTTPQNTPFRGAISRYTHRVAISNERLVADDGGQVTFDYRDRTDGDRRKQLTLLADQFIGRFLNHVLPDGFMRIRHYGFLANRHRGVKPPVIRKLLGVRPPEPSPQESLGDWLQEILDIDLDACPCCGGELQRIELEPVCPVVSITRPRGRPRAPPRKANR